MNSPSDILPQQVILESCDRCNLSCRDCYRSLSPDLVANTVMPWAWWKDIVDSLDWTPAICAFSHGEIFLDRLLPERLAYLASRGHRVDFGTNGTVSRPDVLDVVFAHPKQVYQVVVSLDGLEDRTRSLYRSLPDSLLAKPVDTVHELLRRKAALAADDAAQFNVIVSMVLGGQDRREAEAFVKHWLTEGVDIVLFRRLLDSKPVPAYPKHSCEYLNGHIATVSADGRMRICDRNVNCTWLQSTASATVREIYNGETMNRYREQFPQGPCVTCGQCYSGASFSGLVTFADDSFQCVYRQDYYNDMFFRLDKFVRKTP
jgi:hypothetical protein